MVEAVHARDRLAPAVRVDRLGAVRLAAAHRRRIVPVHGADVIAVATVLHLHLPVAFVDVGRVAAQHFEPVRRLVDDLVDDHARFAEVVLERQHVRVEAAEQEAAIVREARDLLQVVRAVRVELHRVFGRLLVLHLQQLAGVREGPAVERAREAALVAVLAAAQHRALVRTRIDDRMQLAGLVARDDDRLAADPRRVVIVVVGNLAFVRQIHPVALEDVLHLELVQRRVREDVAAATEDAGRLVILHGGFQQVIQVVRSVDGDGHDGSFHARAASCKHARIGIG